MLATNAEAKYVKAIEQLIRKTIAWEGSAAPSRTQSPARRGGAQRQSGGG